MNEADKSSSEKSQSENIGSTTQLHSDFEENKKKEQIEPEFNFNPKKLIGCALVLQLFCFVAVGCAWVLPNLIIGNRNKDKECSDKLWSWVQVFSYTIIGELAIQLIIFLKTFKRGLAMETKKLRSFLGLIGIFMFIWIIMGLVWAQREKGCGTMYTIVLTDCIIVLSSVGLGILCGCCIVCCAVVSGGSSNDKLLQMLKKY
ncbi:hypothetical protein M0812_26774 [Anaeramoeba flamelloides]|uniref:Transmembrane protein n=1 Tax=Anaeramoeba flamelloides TaxID=1746091 RepID=A0AAV7YI86_9EUKA|nr:hypothetical protein M0812_26774 [Anaeramoeba flamelloides]